ncbi:MAG: LemA family protein [Solirubrobacterales bacterium]
MTAIYVLAGIGGVLIAWAIYTYNVLVHLRNKVEEGFSGIDVQLKQRHDLVPNLIETVRGYAQHEQRVLTAATQARSDAVAATAPAEVDTAEQKLATGMRAVIAIAEQYPALRASSHFGTLMHELTEIEDEIQAARRLYNMNAEFYNSRAQQFPAFLIANRMHPRDFAYLRFDLIERDAGALTAGGFAA